MTSAEIKVMQDKLCNAINCLVFCWDPAPAEDVKAQYDNLKISNKGTVVASAQWDGGQELGEPWDKLSQSKYL